MTTLKALLRMDMRKCLSLHPDSTQEEIAALRQWVADGNSPSCNPTHIADESGREMDFISGIRAEVDMLEAQLAAAERLDLDLT